MTGGIWKILVHTALVLCVSVSFANADIIVSSKDQNDAAAKLVGTGTISSSFSGQETTDDEWKNWRKSTKLNLGENKNKNGTFFLAMGSAEVYGSPSKKNWIMSRNIAFQTASLNAKANLAKFVNTEISQGRFLSVLRQGGENPPPAMEEAIDKLSVMDKALTLTDKALDHEIKKYDSDWDGTGRSAEEKEQKLVSIQQSFVQDLSAQSRLFIQGAMVAKIIEGPNSEGRYEVLVGVVWSPRLAEIARAMYTAGYSLALTEPGEPIEDQIEKMAVNNPHILATTEGVFVRTDERGQKVLVSFAAVPLERISTLNENSSLLNAAGYISQFISESVVAEPSQQGGEVFQQYDDDSERVFNTSKYEETIAAISKTVTVSGLSRLLYWKGEHPFSHQRIYVGVYIWSPSNQDMAIRAGELSKDQEQDMKNIGRDGVKNQSDSNDNSASDPAASTVREGFESDIDDF